MDSNLIATNAMRIWHLMNNGATWCYDMLKQATALSDREINAAIGWLAREDTVEIIADPITQKDSYKVRRFWEGCL